MYEGISGCGKSQILMEIEYLAQGESHRWVSWNYPSLWLQRILTSSPPRQGSELRASHLLGGRSTTPPALLTAF
jgi:hypothetical protein